MIFVLILDILLITLPLAHARGVIIAEVDLNLYEYACVCQPFAVPPVHVHVHPNTVLIVHFIRPIGGSKFRK
jgi:hypothetical protein